MEKEHSVVDVNLPGRREFCLQACRGASLLAFGVALGPLLSACKDDDAAGDAPALPIIAGNVSGGTVTVNSISTSALAAVGSAALVQFSGGSLLVAHTAQDVFVALTSVCTHEQCTITGFKDQVYVCPCHGSRFHTSGQVAQGPAASPLRSFPAQLATDQLMITL